MTTLTSGQTGAISGGTAAGCSSVTQYREEINSSLSLSIVGYGCKPLLDASSAISAGAWTKTGGFTNVYQATVSTDTAAGVQFMRAWQNGVPFLQSASLAALDSTASSYYVTSNGSITGTSQVLYIHTSDSSDPGSNGNTYEYNARNYGVWLGSKSLAANIRTRRNLHNDGSFQLGVNSFASDIEADEGTKHNALMHQGSYWQNITLKDSYYAGSAKIALVLNDNIGDGSSFTIVNAAYSETTETGGESFFGHVNSGGAWGTVSLINCSDVGSGAFTSVGGFAAPNLYIKGGTFVGTVALTSTTDTLLNATVSGQIQVPFASTTAEIGGITSSGTFNSGSIKLGNNITGVSLNVHDSSFSNAHAFDDAIYIGTGDTINAFSSQRNIFLAPVQTNHIGGPGAVNLPANSTIDNNTYHYPGAASWIVFRGTTYDISGSGWASWQALGFDTHGSRVTP